jgi:hypothetical protein
MVALHRALGVTAKRREDKKDDLSPEDVHRKTGRQEDQ